jgi:hypothetical protein
VPLIMTDAMRAILRLNGSRANNHANAQAHKHTSRTTPRGFARGPRVGRLSASGKRAHGTARRAMRVRRQAQNRGHLPNTGRRVARPAAARGRRGRELRHGRVCERVRACIAAQDVAQRAGASRVRFCRRQPRTHTRASHAFAVVAQSRRAWRLSHCQAGTGRAVLYIHGTCHVACCTEPEPCPRQLVQPPAIILFARARTLIPASHFARAMEACHDGPAAARVLSVRHRAIEPCLCASSSRARPAPVLLWALRRMAPPAQLRADWADTSGPRRRRIRQDYLGRGWMQLVAELPALPRSAPSLPYSSVRSLRPLHASASTTKALWRCAAMVHASCIVRLASLPRVAQWLRHPLCSKMRAQRQAMRCDSLNAPRQRDRPQVGGAVLGRIPAVHIRAAAAGGAA